MRALLIITLTLVASSAHAADRSESLAQELRDSIECAPVDGGSLVCKIDSDGFEVETTKGDFAKSPLVDISRLTPGHRISTGWLACVQFVDETGFVYLDTRTGWPTRSLYECEWRVK